MADNNIVISVEATCDLPLEVAKSCGISVAPMEYTVGNDVYSTENGLAASECFKRMRGGAITSTGLINQTVAEEYLEGLLKEGKDVIHLGFSSTLSGTFENMSAAAESLKKKYPQRNLEVVDTLCGSGGQALIATVASGMLKDGKSFEEVAFFAKESRLKFCHAFVADDLTYLARSGRVSKIVSVVGNALNLKPVMVLDDDGKFAVVKKVMSRRKSVLALGDLCVENFSGECDDIIILHADCEDEAKILKERVEKGTRARVKTYEFGMVIGSHCGPGTLGVFYMGKRRK